MTFIDHHEPAGKGPFDQVVLPAGGGRQLGQRRMYRPAVVTLGIILEQQLPVGPDVVLDGPRHCEIGEVEPAEAADQRLIRFAERLRIFRQIDEQEAFPGIRSKPNGAGSRTC